MYCGTVHHVQEGLFLQAFHEGLLKQQVWLPQDPRSALLERSLRDKLRAPIAFFFFFFFRALWCVSGNLRVSPATLRVSKGIRQADARSRLSTAPSRDHRAFSSTQAMAMS